MNKLFLLVLTMITFCQTLYGECFVNYDKEKKIYSIYNEDEESTFRFRIEGSFKDKEGEWVAGTAEISYPEGMDNEETVDVFVKFYDDDDFDIFGSFRAGRASPNFSGKFSRLVKIKVDQLLKFAKYDTYLLK